MKKTEFQRYKSIMRKLENKLSKEKEVKPNERKERR